MAPSLVTMSGSERILNNEDQHKLHHIAASPFQTSQPKAKSSTPTDLLEEMEEQFDTVAANYDAKFSEACQAMEECHTIFEYTETERRNRTVAHINQLKEKRESAQLAEAEGADNHVVNSLLEQLDALEEKRHRVLVSIDDLQAIFARLQKESRGCKDTVSALSQKNSQLQKGWEEAQQTLRFIRRLLKGTSNAALHPQTDPDFIEGFIGSDDDKAVIPFKVNAKNPTTEETKAVWDIIVGQGESDTTSSPQTQ